MNEPRPGKLDDDIRRQAVSVIVSANARRRSRRGVDVVDIVTVQAAEEYVEALADRGLLPADLPALATNPDDGNPEGTAAGFTVAVDWGEVEITAPDGTCYARSVEEVEKLSRLFAAAAASARAEYGY